MTLVWSWVRRHGFVVVICAVLSTVSLTVLYWALGSVYPTPMLVLQGLMPTMSIPCIGLAVAMLIARRWVIGVWAGALSIVLVAAMLPLVVADEAPAWVDSAPTITVASANVLFYQHDHVPAVRALREIDVDVIVINESTPELRDLLAEEGLTKRYPYSAHTPVNTGYDEMLMSRLPLLDTSVEFMGGGYVVNTRVEVGGQSVRIVAQHANAPKRGLRLRNWTRSQEAFGDFGHSSSDPIMFVGDFNASPMFGPFRQLTSDGLSDVHELRGDAWKPSWCLSTPLFCVPMFRLDHAVINDRLWPVALRELELPGSDHTGFVTTLAVRTG